METFFYIVIIVIVALWFASDRQREKEQRKQRSQQASAEEMPVVKIVVADRWPATLQLKECGSGKKLDYPRYSCPSVKIVWENAETGEVRTPENRTVQSASGSFFQVGGRKYASLKDLKHQKLENNRYRDVYGLEWLNVYERYPCFDSEDYLYEKRYYEWYLLQDGNRISRVFDNGGGKQFVTDDVGEIEEHCLDTIRSSGYFA